MSALEATALRLLVSSLACVGLGCERSSRASRAAPPTDAGTLVTVYVSPQSADRLMGRLTTIAAQHRWTLSVRTDSAARTEADLVLADSAGTLVARLRPGSPAAAQAKAMAEAVSP